MQLKQLSRILVQFSPATGTARSAREFLARATSKKATASNPECKVEHRLRVKGDPFIEIEYDNKKVERILTANLNVNQILELVQAKAEEMDTSQKLHAAGLQDAKLESKWGAVPGRQQETCSVKFGPRQQL